MFIQHRSYLENILEPKLVKEKKYFLVQKENIAWEKFLIHCSSTRFHPFFMDFGKKGFWTSPDTGIHNLLWKKKSVCV